MSTAIENFTTGDWLVAALAIAGIILFCKWASSAMRRRAEQEDVLPERPSGRDGQPPREPKPERSYRPPSAPKSRSRIPDAD